MPVIKDLRQKLWGKGSTWFCFPFPSLFYSLFIVSCELRFLEGSYRTTTPENVLRVECGDAVHPEPKSSRAVTSALGSRLPPSSVSDLRRVGLSGKTLGMCLLSRPSSSPKPSVSSETCSRTFSLVGNLANALICDCILFGNFTGSRHHIHGGTFKAA